MKKRSLVAALAMLMVSAIVLTSSTYAWFATGTKATVSSVSAQVGNSDGNILVSANNKDFNTSISYDDFEAGANFKPQNFAPVSFNPANRSFIAGTIEQDETDTSTTYGEYLFDASDATTDSGRFIKLVVYVKSSVNAIVEADVDMSSSGYGFIYSALYQGTDNADNYAIYNATKGRVFTPVISAIDGIDSDKDAIMETTDKTTAGADYTGLGSPVEATNDKLTLTLTAEQSVPVVLYVWAEGNDADCVGSVGTKTCTVSINFNKVG